MKMDCSIEKEPGKEIHGYKITEYYIKVSVEVIVDDEIKKQTHRIKMISNGEEEFINTMKAIMNLVQLHDYTNNLRQHFSNLVQFMKKRNSSVKVVLRETEEEQERKDPTVLNFKLVFENKEIYGQLIYKPFEETPILGGYILRFYDENYNLEDSVIRNFAFRRMKTTLFSELLEKKGIHEIFLKLHQEIAKVF